MCKRTSIQQQHRIKCMQYFRPKTLGIKTIILIIKIIFLKKCKKHLK